MQTRQLTCLFWLLAAPFSLPAGTISVQPAAPSEIVGQTFTLSVNITGATDLYGYQFDIGFDPTLLMATSVAEGAFLATGGPTIFLPGTIDNVGGSIGAIGDILNGAVTGVNGSGDLVDVKFRAIGAGSASVQLFNVIALDSVGLGLTETTAGSTVSITGSAVPEPGSWLLLGLGGAMLFGLGGVRKLT